MTSWTEKTLPSSSAWEDTPLSETGDIAFDADIPFDWYVPFDGFPSNQTDIWTEDSTISTTWTEA